MYLVFNSLQCITEFSAMEYCERDLKSVINDGNLANNEAEVWRLFRQILEALEYTHRSKIIHRE
jgi:serine/threonine protein kinase